jgi:hypothetical protein
MTEYKFTNNAVSTLSADIGGGDTSLVVASGQGALFPSVSTGDGTGFYILVEEGSTKEWMLVDDRSGDTFSGISRGGTNSFNAAATIKLALNATILTSFMQKGDYREYAGSPDGILVAEYTGEEVLDTTNSVWYKQISGTTWKLMNGA